MRDESTGAAGTHALNSLKGPAYSGNTGLGRMGQQFRDDSGHPTWDCGPILHVTAQEYLVHKKPPNPLGPP